MGRDNMGITVCTRRVPSAGLMSVVVLLILAPLLSYRKHVSSEGDAPGRMSQGTAVAMLHTAYGECCPSISPRPLGPGIFQPQGALQP